MKSKIKDKYQIQCDYCKQTAKVNMQTTWNKYDIDKDGNYKCDINYDSDIIEHNFHFCNKCFIKWENGELE